MKNKQGQRTFIYFILLLILAACLWLGWSNFEFIKPDVSQSEIRASIRDHIRSGLQTAVQVGLPVLIIVYGIKRFLDK